MNSLIETLNLWGGRIPNFAWPMLWQSSVLIAVLFAFDFAARRKVRAPVRYALWLVLLVKLLLPPSLALPTSLAWWVRSPAHPPKTHERTTAFVVTYGGIIPASVPTLAPPIVELPRRPSLSNAGRNAAIWAVVCVGLLAWLIARWRKVAGDVHKGVVPPESLDQVLNAAQDCIKLPRRARLLVTKRTMSPAVCGLFRPVILLPQSLVERLTPSQLRAVLLHELAHLRRGDVWVNCAQALIQIFYWWHPLLWLANARIRRVREEAVDDAVMLALADDRETYAPTLLEVAKLAFNRPLASLGLVGILESRSALRQRIERLVDFRPPQKAGLTILSSLCVVALAAVAVPMEKAPPKDTKEVVTQKQTESTSPPPVELSNKNEEVKLRMIVLNKPVAGDAAVIRKVAEGIIAKVKGGASFSEMASVYTESRQGREGGDWGWVQKYDRNGALVLRKELADVAFSLKPGEVSGLIETPEVIYLMLVEDKRPAHIKAQSALPSPNSRTTTNAVFTGMGRQAILSKLDQLRLGSVFFDDVPLAEIVVWLKDETRKRDPENHGINFILDPGPTASIPVDPTTGLPVGAAEPADIKSLAITINPTLTDVRLAEVLDAIVNAADKRIKYSIEDYAVVFSGKGTEPEPLLVTRTLVFDPEVFLPNLRQKMNLPEKSTDGEAIMALPIYLAAAGLDLQPPYSYFLKERGLTHFRAPQETVEAIERLFTDLNNGRPQSEIPIPWRPPDRETIIRKLDQIRIDSPAYNETPLIEVIRNLSWETKHQDPERKGLSFHIKYSAKLGKMVDLSAVKVTVPAISKAHLSDLLDAIVKGADKPIMYFIWAGVGFYSTEDEPVLPLGMTLQKALPLVNAPQPTDAIDPTPRTTNTVPVLGDLPFVGKLFHKDIAPATNGSLGSALPKSLYESTPGARIGADLYFQVELREDGSYWASGKRMNLEELRDWLVKTKQSGSNTSIGFHVDSNAPPEAVRALTELRKELGLAVGAAPQLPSSSSAEQLYTRTFHVDPKALYERLENALGISLDDLANGSGQGGALTLPGVDPQEEARIRNPRTLSPDLPRVRDRGGLSFITRTNRMQAVSGAMATFFNALGVDLASPNATALGKAIFWNDHSGTLLVRATKQDLETIEAGIESLLAAPDRNIEAERRAVVTPTNALFTPTLPKNAQPTATATNAAVETRLYRLVAPAFLKNLQKQISESPNAPIQQIITNHLAAAGVNLQPPNLLVFNERNGTLVVRATLPQHELIEQLVQQLNSTRRQINIRVKFLEMPDQVAETFLRELLLTNRTITTNLSVTMAPVQAARVLKNLSAQKGVDILSSPEVTTLSSRQAQVQVVDLRTIVTGDVNPKALTSPGVTSTNVFQLQQMPFGTIFDVMPVRSADGDAIQLTMTATVTEFLGYENPEPTNRVAVYVDGAMKTVSPALPHIRKRQITTSALVNDGETLVLGGPAAEDIIRVKDKVPVLGDLPGAGRLFRTESTATQKKTLIILVTSTLVDEAGNRLHSDDEHAPGPK